MDWNEIKRAYEQVREAKNKGMSSGVNGKCYKVYSMGKNNPVIRIDIKEVLK